MRRKITKSQSIPSILEVYFTYKWKYTWSILQIYFTLKYRFLWLKYTRSILQVYWKYTSSILGVSLFCKGLLNGIQLNLIGSKFLMSSTKFVFWGRSDWLRHFLLLLWNRWMEFNKTWKEARSQCPLQSFWLIGKSRLPAWPIRQIGGTLYSGARYVALVWTPCCELLDFVYVETFFYELAKTVCLSVCPSGVCPSSVNNCV